MWFHNEMYFCIVTDVSPYIIDEENGIVYSPSMKRSESMAQRLKEMREKRENISPTGMFYVYGQLFDFYSMFSTCKTWARVCERAEICGNSS